MHSIRLVHKHANIEFSKYNVMTRSLPYYIFLYTNVHQIEGLRATLGRGLMNKIVVRE